MCVGGEGWTTGSDAEGCPQKTVTRAPAAERERESSACPATASGSYAHLIALGTRVRATFPSCSQMAGHQPSDGDKGGNGDENDGE